MHNDPSSIEEAIEKLNQVSPSFCMAKWMHSTIHLHLGQTHSCYLPPTHKIPLEGLAQNPSALHNTPYKKELRRQMIEGKRPKECQICWDVEDLPEKKYSDRHYRGQDSWITPFYDEVINSHWDQDINPTYLEVSFSSACNFRCSYCNPIYSTSWLNEIKKEGPYPISNEQYQHSLEYIKDNGLMPLSEDDNPYLETFWKWWLDVSKRLMYFRITGGEPLIHNNTYKLLELISKEPLPHLELAINSNFGVPENNFERFYNLIVPIYNEKKVRDFMLHTSIDTYGAQAEYTRNGLNFVEFEKRVIEFLEKLPAASLALTCTYNALSVVGFRKFIEWLLYLRKHYTNRRIIYLDIPHLQRPEYQASAILTPDYLDIIQGDIEYMQGREEMHRGFRPSETLKLRRIHEWIQSRIPKTQEEQDALDIQRANFYHFFTEHDRRRGTNFLQVFPEMADFYQLCQQLAQTRFPKAGEQK